MAYFISSDNESSFKFELEDFKARLRDAFSSVEFERMKLPNDPMALSWKAKVGENIQLCSLHDNRVTVSIDGYPVDVAVLAIWYRRNVPDTVRLFLWHDSWTEDDVVEITPVTDEKALVEKLNCL